MWEGTDGLSYYMLSFPGDCCVRFADTADKGFFKGDLVGTF
jgi:hypothetical protein